MEHFYCVTALSIITCSRWVFADTPAHITHGLSSGSTGIALTNQVTTPSTQQVFASCCSITPVQSNACIMNLCCWSHCTELIQYPCRISVEQQSAAKQLSRESVSFLYQLLQRFIWESFITKFQWRKLKKKVLKRLHQGKDSVSHFIETSS